ncbi:hypothetical protein RRG08_026348 [Elysia crispata]|uniref:Uncharacterized protein n=1 Tax=Elysia crispata TaxID=231223 RepID=A0AAE0XN19_9GAST|nr:hypothetical protein RRG08_026348 [Elysia crispata]
MSSFVWRCLNRITAEQTSCDVISQGQKIRRVTASGTGRPASDPTRKTTRNHKTIFTDFFSELNYQRQGGTRWRALRVDKTRPTDKASCQVGLALTLTLAVGQKGENKAMETEAQSWHNSNTAKHCQSDRVTGATGC